MYIRATVGKPGSLQNSCQLEFDSLHGCQIPVPGAGAIIQRPNLQLIIRRAANVATAVCCYHIPMV